MRNLLVVVHCLLAGLVAGCAHVATSPSQAPRDLKLTLSHDGEWLVARWGEGDVQARLVLLDGTRVAASHDLTLPDGTESVAFSQVPGELLVALAVKGEGGELRRVASATGVYEVLYAGPTVPRHLTALADGSVVFLVPAAPASQTGRWMRAHDGKTVPLQSGTDTSRVPVMPIDGQLLRLDPYMPPRFTAVVGRVPQDLPGLSVPGTFWLHCADRQPRACLRIALVATDDGRYLSRLSVLQGRQACAVPGRWWSRDESISRNGRTVVFQSSADGNGGPLALHVIRPAAGRCEPVEIPWADVVNRSAGSAGRRG